MKKQFRKHWKIIFPIIRPIIIFLIIVGILYSLKPFFGDKPFLGNIFSYFAEMFFLVGAIGIILVSVSVIICLLIKMIWDKLK